MKPTIEQIRAQFPSLKSGFAFFENAGGSQVPQQVIDRVSAFFKDSYVQTSAGYAASDRADAVVAEAKAFANLLMNAGDTGKMIIGPSTTDLIYRLANAYGEILNEGDEIIISVANHESNIGPWVRLERFGVKIVWWGVDPASGDYSYDELERLVTDKTKVIAVSHTSNLLGDILEAKRVSQIARNAGARSVIDGVAFAPHQAIDVQVFGCDHYVISNYKVYAPHMAMLFGTNEAWAELTGPNHYFIEKDNLPWKFELGCQPYELLGGLLGFGEYLCFLEGAGKVRPDRETVEGAYGLIRSLEMQVQERLMGYLLSRDDLRIVGPRTGDESRHPTICFLKQGQNAIETVAKVNDGTVGIRYGHMYASRLCEALGAPVDSGFVRVSAVHYNTLEEADRLIAKLDQI